MKIYLDLLPEQRKQEIKRKKLFGKILREEIMFLFPVIVFVFILVDVYYVLTVHKAALLEEHSIQQSQDNYQKLNIFEEKFEQINTIDQQLEKIQTEHLNWYNLFKQLSETTPEGITITDLATKNYSVFLVGRSRTRDDLLDFKNRLENVTCFQKVNVPLSNLVVKNDVVFQIDFEITKECLKND